MKAYEIPTTVKKPEDLRRIDRPDPKPGPYDVLVRLRAAALNYRDHALIAGTYRYGLTRDTIPCSDGAGEVIAIGDKVTRFKHRCGRPPRTGRRRRATARARSPPHGGTPPGR